MLLNVYWNRKSGEVLVPSEVKTEAGFWMDVEPIQRIQLGDIVSLSRAIQAAFLCSGHTVATPPPESKSVLIVCTNSKTWSVFAKRFSQLSIIRSSENVYTVERYMPAPDGPGRIVDVNARKVMPSNTAVDEVAAEVDTIMRSS